MKRSLTGQQGVVEQVLPGSVLVLIEQKSSCISCQMSKTCQLSECRQRQISVPTPEAAQFTVGEQVNVYTALTTARRAVFIAFAYPFLILLLAICLGLALTGSEPLSAVLGLASVGVYYFLVWTQRRRLEGKVSFFIEKIR